MKPHLRIARPTMQLSAMIAMYRAGLGLDTLGGFEGHDGVDGAMLGYPGGQWHLEFTHHSAQPVAPAPTPEDLLVFYVPDETEWTAIASRMLAAGFLEVEAHNPYWDHNGKTFRDLDGYRVVLAKHAWGRRS